MKKTLLQRTFICLLVAFSFCTSFCDLIEASGRGDKRKETEDSETKTTKKSSAKGKTPSVKRKESEDSTHENGASFKRSAPDEGSEAASASNNEVDRLMRIVLTAMERVDGLMEDFQKEGLSRGITVFVGRTEAGKTTVFHHCLGNALKSFRSPKGLKYRVCNQDDTEKFGAVSDAQVAQTSLPHMGSGFFDTPGFYDNRGEAQNIINAWSLFQLFNLGIKPDPMDPKKLIDTIPKRIVLVLSGPAIIEDRSDSLRAILKALEGMFGGSSGDYQNICRCLSLIITKGHQSIRSAASNIEDFQNFISTVDAEKTGVSAFERDMIKFFASPATRDRITFFYAPTDEGETPDVAFNGKIPPETSYATGLKPEIALEPKTLLKLHHLVAKTLEDLKTFYEELTPHLTQTYMERLLETQSFESVCQLRRHMGSNHSRLKDVAGTLPSGLLNNNDRTEDPKKHLSDYIGETFGSITQILLLEDNWLRRFKNLVDRFSFFVKVYPFSEIGNLHLTFNPSASLNGILSFFESSTKKPTESPNSIIRGAIVGVNDITTIMNNFDAPSTLKIFASQCFFVDNNLTAPSKNLGIGGHILYVPTEKKIDLSGNSGQDSSIQAAGGSPGAPGEPGHHGGEFYGVFNQGIGLNGLKIYANGGNGGKGQQGGNGVDGQAGSNGSKSDLQIKIREQVTNNTDKSKTTFTATSGTPGSKGGDVQVGGKGGKAGNGGYINLIVNGVSSDQFPNGTNGSEGTDGASGTERGKGGQHGERWTGTWMEDKSLVGIWAAAGSAAGAAASTAASFTMPPLAYFLVPSVTTAAGAIGAFLGNWAGVGWTDGPKQIIESDPNAPVGSSKAHGSPNDSGRKDPPEQEALTNETRREIDNWPAQF